MENFKLKSIRQPSKCHRCHGNGYMFLELSKQFHIKCTLCKGTGHTKFKQFLTYQQYEMEAIIINPYGTARKKAKWCVLVYEHINNERVSKNEYTGYGKSIEIAYANAIKKIKKNDLITKSSTEINTIYPIDN